VNTVTASFNTIMGQITEMSQRKETQIESFVVSSLQTAWT